MSEGRADRIQNLESLTAEVSEMITYTEGLDNTTLIGFTLEDGNVVGGVNGGALYIDKVNNAMIDHCIFNNNQSSPSGTGSLDGYGGAIYSEDSNLNISNSQFLNNNAHYGGAIALVTLMNTFGKTINIDNCTFDSNSTVQNLGADIFSYQGDNLNININLNVTNIISKSRKYI